MDKNKREDANREDISRRAHERYQERGGQDGDDQSDWFEAEREISERDRGQSERKRGRGEEPSGSKGE